jgi:hypothetical protein
VGFLRVHAEEDVNWKVLVTNQRLVSAITWKSVAVTTLRDLRGEDLVPALYPVG